jgi:hypothetical protein
MIGIILNEIKRFLINDLDMAISNSDPTKCSIIKIGALQDDPTSGSWCCIKHHPDKGSVAGWPDHGSGGLGSALILGEIGPYNQRWTHYIKVEAGTYASTLDELIGYMDTLGARVQDSLIENADLNDISKQVGSRTHSMVGMQETIIESYTTSIRGGDGDWLGRIEIVAHYHAETT